MGKVEVLLFFHPMPPDPDARLATIGLKLSEADELKEAIKRELERHSIDGMLPGYWSENQRIWFIKPGVWACIHNLLVRLGCAPDKSEDPQWNLYRLKHSTKVLACRQHYSETIIWHLLTTERNLKAWEEKLRVVELYSYQETGEAKRETEAWVKSEREQLNKQYAELDVIKQKLLELTSGAEPLSDSWLDTLEDRLDRFYKKLDNEN